jgi:hypothetical protein
MQVCKTADAETQHCLLILKSYLMNKILKMIKIRLKYSKNLMKKIKKIKIRKIFNK